MQKRFSLLRLPAAALFLALVAAIGPLTPALRAQSVLYLTQTTGNGAVRAYSLPSGSAYAAGSALTTTTFGSSFFQSITTDFLGNVYVAYPAGGLSGSTTTPAPCSRPPAPALITRATRSSGPPPSTPPARS